MNNLFKKVYLFLFYAYLRVRLGSSRDEWSKIYSANPDCADEYLFFNKIDLLCAASVSLYDAKKLKLVECEATQQCEIVRNDRIFLNLTDHVPSNLILMRDAIKLANKLGCFEILYRAHPRVPHNLERDQEDLQIDFVHFDSTKHDVFRCGHIVSGVSSFICQMQGYRGQIWISMQGSASTFSEGQVMKFVSIARRYLQIDLTSKY